jgi:hypothetical protein
MGASTEKGRCKALQMPRGIDAALDAVEMMGTMEAGLGENVQRR